MKCQQPGSGGYPLSGVKILDLTRATAGPFASMMMADLGAEVIKIENPDARGMTGRDKYDPEYLIGGEEAHFLALNRNKKSIAINLKEPKGKEVFIELAKSCDVVLDNFKPGVRRRLGIDYETLAGANSRIISCSITGFGPTGPYADRPAFDVVVQATSGMMAFIDKRDSEDRPNWSRAAMADLAGGMLSAYGVTAALYRRQQTGKGQEVNISLQDALVALLIDYALYPLNLGFFRDPVAGYLWGTFRTKDRYIVIYAHWDGLFKGLCQALGREEWLADSRFGSTLKRTENREQLFRLIEEVLCTKPASEWVQLIGKANVPCAIVNSVEEAVNDPQTVHQNMVVNVLNPDGQRVKLLGNPIKMSDIQDQVFVFPPTLGQHTSEILRDLLGYTDQKIDELRAERIIQ